MKTTIDSAGRIVIPKEVRRQANLKPGTAVTVRWAGGRIEIEPEPIDVTLTRRGRFLVASPVDEVSSLRGSDVEQARRQLRRR